MHDKDLLTISEKAITTFFSEEINMDCYVANFYLQWLLDDSSYHLVSGNSFFLDKKDDAVIIGNLFDQSFIEIEVSKQELINYINCKIG